MVSVKNNKYIYLINKTIPKISIPILVIYSLYSIFVTDLYTFSIYLIVKTWVLPIVFILMAVHGIIEWLLLNNKSFTNFFWVLAPFLIVLATTL